MKNKGNVNQEVQYGGFVKNSSTGQYDCLFTTFCSELLAHGRAREKALENNECAGAFYDINDIVVRRRTIEYTVGSWE